jgi:DNA-binding MarR family transcriptional regulator
MDKLIDLLAEVSSGFQLRLQELAALQELALAPFQARLLAIVARRPGCSQQELAGWTGRDKAQIARTIKELEARRLLLRSAHETDWRSHSLAVTPDGERACVIIAKERTELGVEVTQNFTPSERAVMAVALQKMKARLDDLRM